MEQFLIPMTEYTLKVIQTPNINEAICLEQSEERLFRLYQYALFLNQKLTERYDINGVSAHPLNRFVPCDLEGNVLEPPNKERKNVSLAFYHQELKLYKEAEGRVLFKGCAYVSNTIVLLKNQPISFGGSYNLYVIEDIIPMLKYKHYNIELTDSAKKLLGIKN